MGRNRRERKRIDYKLRAEKMELVIGEVRAVLELTSDSSEIPVRKICDSKIKRIQKIIKSSKFKPISVCRVIGVEIETFYPDKR